MDYITRADALQILRNMRRFETGLKSFFASFDYDLHENLGRRNILLSNAQEKDGGFRCLFLIDKHSNHAYKKDQIYSFDNGVIINGLVSLYKETNKPYLIKSAEKCANWLKLLDWS